MHVSRTQPKKLSLGLQPAIAWTAIIGFILVATAGIFGGAAGLMRLVFPAGSLVVGWLLYQRYPILYMGFTWWLWILTPWVRRVIDYKSGWDAQGVVLLTPFLVTLLTFFTFLRYFPQSVKRDGAPFILPIMGVCYGYAVGLIRTSPVAATVAMLNWLCPLLMGFHLFVHWRDYPQYRQNFRRIFLWGVLLTGIYGVIQYLIAPEWDRFWLINSEALAFGQPEPLKIRVFSTMNSPQPFAMFMMAGLLLLLNTSSVLKIPAAGVGYLSFLLSLARSTWLGWMVGLAVFVPSLKPRFQMRLVLSLMVMAVCVLPLLTMEPFSDVIGDRLQSFSNTEDDVSYTQRTAGYREALGIALTEVVGRGIGFVLESDSLGSNDSGILSLLFSLGWLGALPYLAGIGLLLLNLFRASKQAIDPFMNATRAIAISIFIQIGLNSILIGVFGVLLWSFIGISMAAQKYHAHFPDPPREAPKFVS